MARRGKKRSNPTELGPVIAERTLTLFRSDGTALPIALRVGKPFKEPTLGDYRCAAQIVGIGDERVYAPWGEDPFVALQYAIDVIGEMLDDLVRRESLEIRFRPGKLDRTSWIWRYPPK